MCFYTEEQLCFVGLPSEVHAELIAYLSICDCIAISQTCTTVRDIYQNYTWRYCDVAIIAPTEYESYRNLHRAIWTNPNIAIASRRRVIPMGVFLAPLHYTTWFRPWAIQDLCVINPSPTSDNYGNSHGTVIGELWENFLKSAGTAITIRDPNRGGALAYGLLNRLEIANDLSCDMFSNFCQSPLRPFLDTIPTLKIPLTVQFPPNLNTNNFFPIRNFTQNVLDHFSYVTDLRVIGSQLFVSSIPQNIDLKNVCTLILVNLRTPLLAFILEKVARKEFAPKLREVVCEMGAYQRNDVIYVQTAISALAKLPTNRIENFLLHITSEKEGTFMRCTPQEFDTSDNENGTGSDDRTRTPKPLYDLGVVTQLKVDQNNFDLTLFSRIFVFRRLRFLQCPVFNVLNSCNRVLSLDYFNIANQLTKVSLLFESALNHQKLKAFTSLTNLRQLQLYGNADEFFSFVPEFFMFLWDGIRHFYKTSRVLTRDEIAKLLMGKYKALPRLLKNIRPVSMSFQDWSEDDEEEEEYDDDGELENTNNPAIENDNENENINYNRDDTENDGDNGHVLNETLYLERGSSNLESTTFSDTSNQNNLSELTSSARATDNHYFWEIVDMLALMYENPSECMAKYHESSQNDYGKLLILALCFTDCYVDIIARCPRLEFVCLDFDVVRKRHPSIGIMRFFEQHIKSRRPDLSEGKPRHSIKQCFVSMGQRDWHQSPRDTTYGETDLDIPDDEYYGSYYYGVYPKDPCVLKMKTGRQNQMLIDLDQRRQFHVPTKDEKSEGCRISLNISDFFKKDFNGWI